METCWFILSKSRGHGKSETVAGSIAFAGNQGFSGDKAITCNETGALEKTGASNSGIDSMTSGHNLMREGLR